MNLQLFTCPDCRDEIGFAQRVGAGERFTCSYCKSRLITNLVPRNCGYGPYIRVIREPGRAG